MIICEFLPLGFDLWRKSHLCLTSVTKEQNSEHPLICHSISFSFILSIFFFFSLFFFVLNFFSENHLISSPVSYIYDEAFMDWVYLITHVYSCGCNCFIALCYMKMSYINRLPLPGNHRSCANVYVCLSEWLTSVLAADKPTSVPLHNASALSLQFNISLQISASFIYINCVSFLLFYSKLCVCVHTGSFFIHKVGKA